MGLLLPLLPRLLLRLLLPQRFRLVQTISTSMATLAKPVLLDTRVTNRNILQKKMKTCSSGQIATETCLACPPGHTCANGEAKTDGKYFTTTTTKAPAATTKKTLSNSNTISVTL